jgi:hypothetical protein
MLKIKAELGYLSLSGFLSSVPTKMAELSRILKMKNPDTAETLNITRTVQKAEIFPYL